MHLFPATQGSSAGRSAVIGVSLLASFSTLTCCALPALFVSLGAGAALAGVVSAMPFLVTLSEHKAAVFGFSAVMLAVAAMLQWRARSAPCPAGTATARWCAAFRRVSWSMIGLSAAMTSVGAFYAFAVAHMYA